MKTRYNVLASIAVLLAVTSTSACATPPQDQKAADDLTTKKEICFRMHGKLMSKPALMNLQDCWRVHAYLMDR